MKKYAILTSVLALAACGGGGHGGGGIVAPDTLSGRISDAAAGSNQAVTKMKSQVIVSDKTSVDLSRSATATVGDVTFTSYDLSDVKLYAADAEHTSNGYLKIGMDDNGRIDNVKLVVGGGEAEAAPVARMGETAKFNSPILEYVADSFARVNGSDFSVADNDAEIRDAISDARNFGEGNWEQVGDVWKYRRAADSQFATVNGSEFSVEDGTDNLLAAVRDAYSFDGGKWVEQGGNYKYIEYGDQAIYRIVDTGQTKEQLDNLAHDFALGHWNRADEFMNVVTYGGDIGNGQQLQYADFGHFNPIYKTKLVDLTDKVGDTWNSEDAETPRTDEQINQYMNEEDYQLFAGGYAIQGTELKDSLDAPRGAEFKGKAIGRVYTSLQGGNRDDRSNHFATYGITDTGQMDDGHDISKAFVTQDATLKIDADGKQTLSMPFNTKAVGDRYYDVKIVQNANGIVENPEFTGDENAIDSQYRLYDALEHVQEKSVKMGYYGVNVASEAAGTAEIYSEHDLDGVVSREYEVQAAYGMKRQ